MGPIYFPKAAAPGIPPVGKVVAYFKTDNLLYWQDSSGTEYPVYPALTGDVTTVAGALAATIATNVVSNTKLAQMAANTFKANNTGSAANAADITAAQAAAVLNAAGGGVLRTKLVVTTKDTSAGSGDSGYTGAGFAPSAAIVIVALNNAVFVSIGFADQAKSGACLSSYAAGTFADYQKVASIFTDLTAANLQQAVVKSWDSDGMTLTWTKTGTPTGTANMYILFLA